MSTISMKNVVIDTGVGIGSMTAPWWLSAVEVWAQAFLVLGGALIMGIRVFIIVRELRRHRANGDNRSLWSALDLV